MSALRVFRLSVDKDERARYGIDGVNAWTLPRVHCSACGSTWAATGEAYPTVVPPNVERFIPSPSVKILNLESLSSIRQSLQEHVPEGSPIMPGAGFGPYVATARGKMPDLPWPEFWTMFMKREVFETLRDRGIKIPRVGTPQLTWRGRGGLPDLVEPEAPPLIDVVGDWSDPLSTRCTACGRRSGWWQRWSLPADTKFPALYDIVRARNAVSVYLITETFAEAFKELELTGFVLKPVAIE